MKRNLLFLLSLLCCLLVAVSVYARSDRARERTTDRKIERRTDRMTDRKNERRDSIREPDTKIGERISDHQIDRRTERQGDRKETRRDEVRGEDRKSTKDEEGGGIYEENSQQRRDLLQTFDLDADGQISKEEMEEAYAVLDSLEE